LVLPYIRRPHLCLLGRDAARTCREADVRGKGGLSERPVMSTAPVTTPSKM
jgi:hypothetical protein